MINLVNADSLDSVSPPYSNLIASAAEEHDIDPGLLQSLVGAESSFDPNAESGKGAKGLTQLMPGTAKEVGVKDSTDPAQNINGGAAYLAKMLKHYNGNVRDALMAYNMGAAALDERRAKGLDGLPASQAYADKVLAGAQKSGGGINLVGADALDTPIPQPKRTPEEWKQKAEGYKKEADSKAQQATPWNALKGSLGQDAADIVKEPVGMAAGALGALGHSSYEAAAGLKGLGSAALSGSLGQGADTINAMMAHEPHPLSSPLAQKYVPDSKIANMLGQHVVQPGINALGGWSGHPQAVQETARAAGDIAALFPLSSAFKGGASEVMGALGETAGKVVPVVGDVTGAIGKGVGRGIGATAQYVGDQIGLSDFSKGLGKALAPKDEAAVSEGLRKYVTRLGGPPPAFIRNAPDPIKARDFYTGREALATDEMLQQAHRDGVSPDEYRKTINVEREAQNIPKVKAAIFKEFDTQLKDAAADGGVVPVKPVVSYWQEQLSSRYVQDHGLAPYVENKIETLKNSGDYTLSDAQNEIQGFNSKVSSAQLTQGEYDRVKLDAGANKTLRGGLDTSIETLGQTYQGLKTKYSAIKQHEELITRALGKHIKSTDIPKGTFLDAIASIEGVRGVLMMNPKMLITAAASEGVATWRRIGKDVNRALRGLYDVRAAKFTPREFYEPGTATGAERAAGDLTSPAPPSAQTTKPAKVTNIKLGEVVQEYPEMTVAQLQRLVQGESPENIILEIKNGARADAPPRKKLFGATDASDN